MFSAEWKKTDYNREKRWHSIYHKSKLILDITDRSKNISLSMASII